MAKTVTKKAAKTPVRKIYNSPATVKIILEIVLRDAAGYKPLASLSGGAGAPEISYEFSRDQMTLISLSVDNKTVVNPTDKGDITLDFIPISGQLVVSAYATGNGTGSLQLTFEGKKLFKDPVDFEVKQGHGFINQLVKLF
jgi:hypothetical protein